MDMDLVGERVKQAVLDEIQGLVELRWATVWKNYRSAFQAFAEDNPESDKQFTFPMKFSAVLVPEGKEMEVGAALAYGVKRKHVSAGQTVQLDLPFSVKTGTGAG